MRVAKTRLVAFFWGLAEACCFFIVPDVWLSYLALTHYRRALHACCYALMGALCGGALLFAFAMHHPSTAHDFLLNIPGISSALVMQADGLIRESLLHGMVSGAFQGIPYKVFCVQAAALGASPLLFLLYSIPARLIRFVLVVSLVAFLSHILLKRASLRTRRILFGISWIGFYGWYFTHMGW